MKSQIVADGAQRLRDAQEMEHQAQEAELRKSIRAKYAAAFKHATLAQRLKLQWKMWQEFEDQRQCLPKPAKPSPYALYASQIIFSPRSSARTSATPS